MILEKAITLLVKQEGIVMNDKKNKLFMEWCEIAELFLELKKKRKKLIHKFNLKNLKKFFKCFFKFLMKVAELIKHLLHK